MDPVLSAHKKISLKCIQDQRPKTTEKKRQIEGSTLEMIFQYHLEASATRAEVNEILSNRNLSHN